MNYDFKDIETRWQNYWEINKPYATKNDLSLPKFYCLDMFPYPSSDGLHVGHWKGYVFSDLYARLKFHQGYNVLHPMGYDAFGLPAENYALKMGIHPAISTANNIAKFDAQLKTMGTIFDWDKKLSTTDPEYYKWTQWIFLKMLERGLAYQSEMPINWCPKCLTGLANEEATGGQCDRCGSDVEQKNIRQWVLKITAYADQFIDDLAELDWPEKVKLMQTNWVGRSHGLRFKAPVKDLDLEIEMFSAHFEAFMSDTFIAIAPDHHLLDTLIAGTPQEAEVRAMCKKILDARAGGIKEEKEIEGIFTGRYMLNPWGGDELPIWVASFALAHYGTGIVRCDAHDERDFAFAKKYNIPLKVTLLPEDPVLAEKVKNFEICYTDMKNGILLEPTIFAGKRGGDVREEIIQYCEKMGFAKRHTSYKLRDWIFSRQRYWGEPIPVIHCQQSCGVVPVPESQLPVLLPEVERYQPTGTGESPLAGIDWWVNTTCPTCGGPGKRETNTMPQWAGSCWYFLRYLNPKLETALATPEDLKYWMPVDLYVGGIEHAVLHLLYARFYVKVLYDAGILPFKEPFKKLFNQGMVCLRSATSGRVEKMSKSKGNTVSPDAIAGEFGVDSLRTYMLFMGPPEQDNEWQTDSIRGVNTFVKKLWAWFTAESSMTTTVSDAALRRYHQFLKDYTERLDDFKVNTAVASIMEFYNDFHAQRYQYTPEIMVEFLTAISLMMPYLASEILDKKFGRKLDQQRWPKYDPELAKSATVQIPVQVNGKLRATLDVPVATPTAEIEELARKSIAKWLENSHLIRMVHLPYKLINFVIK